MKKLRSKAGFTLMELLLALMIMVFIVVGIGVGMNSGMKIYQEANFEADSATLAGILNTNLGDLLRYSENVQNNDGTLLDSEGHTLEADKVPFVFTNLDYGVQNAYFYTYTAEDGTGGVLQLKNLNNSAVMDLVNSGAYPNLTVKNFEIEYVDPESATRGGYFKITYHITNKNNATLDREVNYIVRLLNA